MKFIVFVVGIIATAIVIYNNMIQLYSSTTNVYDILSLCVVILGTIIYSNYNKDKMLKI